MSTQPQLTYEQRCQIYALIKIDFTQEKIADEVGVHPSTISRELGRNSGKKGYRPKQAQRLADQRRKNAAKPSKMTPDNIAIIEEKLRLDWSPEQISGWLLDEHQQLLSHETIYLHVWSDKKSGGNLHQHLRRQGKA